MQRHDPAGPAPLARAQDARALAEAARGREAPPGGLLASFRRCVQLLAARLALAGDQPPPPPPAPAAPWAAAAAAEAAADADVDADADADAGPERDNTAQPSPAGSMASNAPVAGADGVLGAMWQRGSSGALGFNAGGGGADGGDGGRGPGPAVGRAAGRGEPDQAAGSAEQACAWGDLAGDLDALAGRPSREELTVAVRALLEAGDAVRGPQP